MEPHPHGIQPLGNLYFKASCTTDDSKKRRKVLDIRPHSLGPYLSSLSDQLLFNIFSFFDCKDLALVSSTSPVIYAISYHDEFWRTLVLGKYQNTFAQNVQSTWRDTFVNITTKTIPHSSSKPPPISIDGFYSDLFYQSFKCASFPISEAWLRNSNVDRRSNVSLTEFQETYEIPNIPVIFTDIVPTWDAYNNWSPSYLIEKCGSKSLYAGGCPVTMKEYYHYCNTLTTDDQPLFIFDKHFGSTVPDLVCDYNVPSYFDDLFKTLDDDTRPAFRWLIIGPAKSGSSFHIDPNSTSAWNAVLRGKKKWILIPPEYGPPPGVFPSSDDSHVTTSVSVTEWFINFYHQLHSSYDHHPGIVKECIVSEGEMIFVPRGWWHIVLNVEDSIAITQNFVSKTNLPHVLSFLKTKADQISGLPTADSTNFYEKFTTALTSQNVVTEEDLECKTTKVSAILKEKTEFTFGFSI